MQRIIGLIILLLLLVGCSNETNDQTVNGNENNETLNNEVEEVITEVVSEQEHEIVLLDNEDLKITMLNTLQKRMFDYETKDVLYLEFDVENKKNRTFNILLDNVSFDGSNGDYNIGMTETEIGPEEQVRITANFFLSVLEDDKKISFEEHLSGRFTYRDFDGNREVVEFSEYINQ